MALIVNKLSCGDVSFGRPSRFNSGASLDVRDASRSAPSSQTRDGTSDRFSGISIRIYISLHAGPCLCTSCSAVNVSVRFRSLRVRICLSLNSVMYRV